MSRAAEFLDKYKRLENLAEEKFDCGRYSPLIFLANSREFGKYATELNYCREVRNVISHNPRLDGSYIVEPSVKMLEFLDFMIRELEHPKRCLQIAVRVERVLTASPETFVLPVMREMFEKGYSHVPVLSDGRVSGVFSANAVFKAIMRKNKIKISEETVFGDLGDLISLDDDVFGSYAFVSKNARLFDVKQMFKRRRDNSKLRMIFITDNGRREERLLAILTPWDILGDPAEELT